MSGKSLFCLSILFLSSFHILAQHDEFFNGPLEKYSLWNIDKYYSNVYPTEDAIIDAAKRNSIYLKEKDDQLFCMNQFYLSRELIHDGQEEKGFNIIAELEKSATVQNSPKLLGYLYNVKGGQQFTLQRPKEGRKFYKKALRYLREANDSIGIKGNLINLANSYSATGDYDSAQRLYYEALALQEEGIDAFRPALIVNLGVLYINKKEFRKAIPLLKEGYQMSIENKNEYGQGTAAMDISECYIRLDEYDSSMYYANLAQQKFLKSGNLSQLITVNRVLIYSYAGKKQYKKSFEIQRIVDSLTIEKNRKDLPRLTEELHLKYQKELHDKEAKIQQQKINQEKQLSKRLYVFSAVTLILLLLIGLLYFRIRNKNSFLAEKNLELTKRQAAKLEQKKKVDLKAPQELITALEAQFYIEKVFIDSELTIDKLAKKMGTNRTYLSETINYHFGKPFRTLVNHLRIQEARTLLLDKNYAHYSIEGIATSVGYRNISSFNSAFKKETGITPSFFRKRYSNT